MSRCKCDWNTPQAYEIGAANISKVTSEDMDVLRDMFRAWLVIDVLDGRRKEVFCTACNERNIFEKPTKRDVDIYSDYADIYKLHHRDMTTCPFCGKSAEVVYVGRMGNSCKKMFERQRAVIFHDEPGGWLSARAVFACKDYDGKYWDTDIDISTTAIYMFRPGVALGWRRNYMPIYDCKEPGWHPVTHWKVHTERMKTICEPFQQNNMDVWNGVNTRLYTAIGMERIGHTDMRYCAADLFVDEADNGRFCEEYGLIRYLGEYCHRPSMEMAMKLGITDAVEDLIYSQRSNHRIINWRANSLAGFLRLDKAYVKPFLNGNRTLNELQIMQTMQNKKLDTKLFAELSKLKPERIKELDKHSPDGLTKTLRYLIKQQEGISSASQLWLDYIRMGEKLKYDFSEETVRFPKRLRERHDIASDQIYQIEHEEEIKKYKRIYKKLCQRYEFAGDEFEIVVPENAGQIISEGKTLHHCVGGYATRHCKGECIILFLRRREQHEIPYGTIELSAKKIGELIQLRGEHNCAKPKEASEAFVATWIAWIKAGSQRDSKGNPVLMEEMRVSA